MATCRGGCLENMGSPTLTCRMNFVITSYRRGLSGVTSSRYSFHPRLVSDTHILSRHLRRSLAHLSETAFPIYSTIYRTCATLHSVGSSTTFQYPQVLKLSLTTSVWLQG